MSNSITNYPTLVSTVSMETLSNYNYYSPIITTVTPNIMNTPSIFTYPNYNMGDYKSQTEDMVSSLCKKIAELEAQLRAVPPAPSEPLPVVEDKISGKSGIPLRALQRKNAQVGFFVLSFGD